MRAYERLLEYVKVKTPSSEENMETPSSSCQFELAERLVGEMKELGIEDAAVDGKCYVYGQFRQRKVMRTVHLLDLSHIWTPFQNLRKIRSIRFFMKIMTDRILFLMKAAEF